MATNSPQQGKKSLALRQPANADQNVFIPLEETVTKVKEIVASDNGSPTFLRAPVATGKTTLAIYLNSKHSDTFLLVPPASTESIQVQNIVQAIQDRGLCDGGSSLPNALRSLASRGITLVLDEAHMIFGYTNLLFELLKAPQHWSINCLKILFFSAASETVGNDGITRSTPPEIHKMYMWHAPMPDPFLLVDELSKAEVYLDTESVQFFLKLCSGHRGVFMNVMDWVRERQRDHASPTSPWDIHESVSRVRGSYDNSETGNGWKTGLREFMTRSRAVHVNGKYNDLENVPIEFLQVLYGGPKSKKEIGNAGKDLTIAGFLTPGRERMDEEFVLLSWDCEDVMYGVANSIMAEYYISRCADSWYEREWTIGPPSSAIDLLARALPFMNFSQVVDNPLPSHKSDLNISRAPDAPISPLSADALPYEDNYNGAISVVLKHQRYKVTNPLNPLTGKVDVAVRFAGSRTCAFETIMATRADHVEHEKRFADPQKTNYSGATFKAVITIGANRDTVKRRLAQMHGNVPGLELIGLVVSVSHDWYELFIRPSLSQTTILGPFVIVCDSVARSVSKNGPTDYRVVSACQLAIHGEKKKKKKRNKKKR